MAEPFKEDLLVYPAMIELSACLCTELANSGLPTPCFCGVLPGGDVVYDFCGECGPNCGGQAWVRLVSAYPSTIFPQVDSLSATCTTRTAFQLEVGVVRCAPAMGPDGEPPSLAAQLEATRLQMADMAAMRRAILCCFGGVQNPNDPYSTRDIALGQYTPSPTAGGCIGGVWNVVTW